MWKQVIVIVLIRKKRKIQHDCQIKSFHLGGEKNLDINFQVIQSI